MVDPIKVDAGYRIKKPDPRANLRQIITRMFLQAYKDLQTGNYQDKKTAIIFFSDEWCDCLCPAIQKDPDKAYAVAKSVYSGEISLKISDYEQDT